MCGWGTAKAPGPAEPGRGASVFERGASYTLGMGAPNGATTTFSFSFSFSLFVA